MKKLQLCSQTSLQLSGDDQARSSAEALELILALDSLRSAHKKYKVRISTTQGLLSAQGQGPSAHAPPPVPHPPPTAGTNNTAAGSTGQHTLTSASDEGGELIKYLP